MSADEERADSGRRWMEDAERVLAGSTSTSPYRAEMVALVREYLKDGPFSLGTYDHAGRSVEALLGAIERADQPEGA